MIVTKHSNIFAAHCLLLAAVGMIGCAMPRLPAANVRYSTQTPVTPPLTPASNIRTAQAQTSLEALRRGEPIATYEGIVLKDIFFEFNSFDLSDDARATLRAAADWLRDHPVVRAEIEGHSDERGTSEYNLALGAKRAYAAKDFLISMGIAEHRLSTISYGEEIPVCREANEQCWQRNRRARFVPSSGTPGV